MEKTTLSNQSKQKNLFAVLCGVGAGVANGLFGGGGGMIVVPMLTGLLKYPTKSAHATAILIILPLSIVSGLFYVAFGIQVKVLLPVLIGVIAGGILGALLLNKISNKWITVIFAVLMAAAGVKMLLF